MNGFLSNERGGIARWIVILIVIAAGVYGYTYFKKTPRYAMIQFKKAILVSSPDKALEYMDIESVVRGLPNNIAQGQSEEQLKTYLIKDIDSPSEKRVFKNVKSWAVLMGPISIQENQLTATMQPIEGTTVTLTKTTDQRWIITSLNISERPKE